MFNIKQFKDWNNYSWEAMLNIARNKTTNPNFIIYLAKCREHNDYDEFKLRPVTGEIAEGWIDPNVDNKILFQDLLGLVYALYTDWTIAEYLLVYEAICDKRNIPYSMREYGRVLRNLPSFLREYILYCQLVNRGCIVRIPSSVVNAVYHVDLILINNNGVDVNIWNYLHNNEDNLKACANKAKNRGCLISGLNLTAPVKFSEYNDSGNASKYLGWILFRPKHIDKLIKIADGTPSTLTTVNKLHNPGFFRKTQLVNI